MAKKADKILIGGGMAFTFLQSEGFNIGTSIIDYDNLDFCQKMIEKYPNKIVLPVDVKQQQNTIMIQKCISKI